MQWLSGKFSCLDEENCGSSDGLTVGETDEGNHIARCFVCEKSFSPNQVYQSYLKDELGLSKPVQTKGRSRNNMAQNRTRKRKKSTRSPITQEQIKEVKAESSWEANEYRGIKDSVCKFYGVLTGYSPATGEVEKRYYPVSEDATAAGYKIRNTQDKTFGLIGKNSNDSDLFGQIRFKSGKYLLIVGGEEDTLAGYQMLEDYQVSRGNGDYPRVAVVSCTNGEGTTAEQVRENYDFVDSFENIIVMMDDDDAGDKALDKLLEVLPLEKTKIFKHHNGYGDACDYLKDGKGKLFVNGFYDAEKPSFSGILSSTDIEDRILEVAAIDKIPLPPFLMNLDNMLIGGFPLGCIVNILAASGVGKTTIVNELVYDWVFSSPHKVGILSFEASAGKYGENLLSRHLGRKIALIRDKEEKAEYIISNRPRNKTLWQKENGEARFELIDDRGELDSLDEIKKKVMALIRAYGVKVIVIDPLQDAIDFLSNEDQAAFLGWMKKTVSQEMVTFININHSRKSANNSKKQNSQGGELSEEDMAGSSTIFKSGAINILISRNKHADCEIERNTTKIVLSKNRDIGITGKAGELYYDVETHQMHDKEWFFNKGAGKGLIEEKGDY